MKKNDYYFYPAVFGYKPGEKISVFFPDLDVATSGEDDIDALKSARELLGITMWGIEDDGEDIPKASNLCDIQCEEYEKVALVDVYMPSIRLMNVNKSVNRTVTLPAWLNAVALEHNVNFSQVLQDALKEQFHLV